GPQGTGGVSDLARIPIFCRSARYSGRYRPACRISQIGGMTCCLPARTSIRGLVTGLPGCKVGAHKFVHEDLEFQGSKRPCDHPARRILGFSCNYLQRQASSPPGLQKPTCQLSLVEPMANFSSVPLNATSCAGANAKARFHFAPGNSSSAATTFAVGCASTSM